MSKAQFNSPEERLAVVGDILRERGTARIDELAPEFGVSEMTIRRDLDELEALGVARRVRGGAIALGPETFSERHRRNSRAKASIADKLKSIVPPSGTVALDASTTIHRLATAIDTARDLTVVTNGPDAFAALSETPGVSAYLTGGMREPRTESLVGPIAAVAAASFMYDVFVCSAAAVDQELGSSEISLAEVQIKRAFAGTSGRVVLAIDRTKLSTRAPARMLALAEVDLLVTELDPGDRRLDGYRDSVEII
jgi:DeoR/GlpR family transcriptional regulator of sugar metabolism